MTCGICGKSGDNSSLPLKTKIGKALATVCVPCAKRIFAKAVEKVAMSEQANPEESALASGMPAIAQRNPVALR